MNGVYYSDYLALDKILNAQEAESTKAGQPAHDEMLFIIVHQAYELWFKQLMHELEAVIATMAQPGINDNSPDLQLAVHRLQRMITILRVLVHQIDIIETMTPMDFLEFRDRLRPASGFQSFQFKIFEARLGLKYEHRHAQQYYLSQLRPEHVKLIQDQEQQPTLLVAVNEWLQRMPFFDHADLWKDFSASTTDASLHPFWSDYRARYSSSLSEMEKGNVEAMNEIFFSAGDAARSLSPRASRAALFIMLFRGYPLLHLPFQLLNALLEIDEQLSTWRYRHMNMVHRMIGTRVGTGGSTGKEYLRGALDKHYIFKEVALLTSFLLDRARLPQPPAALRAQLGFAG